ncbi:MAG: hypothetical protein MUF64_14380 [Polyangiaceae bacterium]|nr:hypothetical protein [Polyangiaceae bacterium]
MILARRTASIALALVLTSATAAADGAHGRLDGDLAPALEAGAALGPGGLAPAARASLLYLATAGAQATWFAPRHGHRSALALGVELRPLFLPRFLKDRERGPARLDLLIDSVHLGLAARLGPRRPGLDLSLGAELPLSASFAGWFLGLRLLRHWPHEALDPGLQGAQTQALFTLGYRAVLQAHLVDARDRILR